MARDVAIWRLDVGADAGDRHLGRWLFDVTAPLHPVPPDRGRWRFTLHSRQFAAQRWESNLIAELSDARARKLTQAWNVPAELTFSMDGDSLQASQVLELATDVRAWRWDEQIGADRCMFRGMVDHSEDAITEESATVTFVAHDYLGMLNRRYLTLPYATTARDQDFIVSDLLTWSYHVFASDFTAFTPGSYLPLHLVLANPDGSIRGVQSGVNRDQALQPNQSIGAAILAMAQAGSQGFDLAVESHAGSPTWPAADTEDSLRIFYPQQGVTRGDVALVYGSNVRSLTRTVASDTYANYTRCVGNKASADPNAAQLFADAWNSDTNDITVNPVGLFMSAPNASALSLQSEVDAKAQGDLRLWGLIVPTYAVVLEPDAYLYGAPNMGDTIGLVIQRGRLDVNTQIRVLGIAYDIGDDDTEDVGLVLGRPLQQLADMDEHTNQMIDALARR
jgi:hypothetical protein